MVLTNQSPMRVGEQDAVGGAQVIVAFYFEYDVPQVDKCVIKNFAADWDVSVIW